MSWYYKDLDKTKRLAANNRLLKNYGITITDYDKMLKAQDGVCFICGKAPVNVRLCVDHRHVKGYKLMSNEDKKKEVRGLLCFMCNVGLGKIEKTTHPRIVLEGMARYAKRYKLRTDP